MIHIEYAQIGRFRWVAFVINDNGYPIHVGRGVTRTAAERAFWRNMNTQDDVLDYLSDRPEWSRS